MLDNSRHKQAGLLRVTRSAYARNLLIKWFVDFDLPIQYDGMYESEYGQIPDVLDLVPLEKLIDETLGGEWGKEESEGRYTHAIRCIRGTDIPNVQKSYYEDIPVRYVQKKHIDEKGIKANDIIVEISGGSPIQSTGRIFFLDFLSYGGFGKPCSAHEHFRPKGCSCVCGRWFNDRCCRWYYY